MGNVVECSVCPTCKAEGESSSITKEGHHRTTLVMPVKYYDGSTKSWKTTNPNVRTYTYMCSRGHKFEEKE